MLLTFTGCTQKDHTLAHTHRRAPRPGRRHRTGRLAPRLGPRPPRPPTRAGCTSGKIQYDSPGKDTRTNTSLNAEYVDIHNNGKSKRPAQGLQAEGQHRLHLHLPQLQDRRRGRRSGSTPARAATPPAHVYWSRGSYVWNNTGDKARLIKPSGALLDSCSWGKGTGVKVCH